MTEIKKSLEENREHILGELPREFHADFEAEIERHSKPTAAETESDHEKIINELRYHPNIDAEVVGEFDPEAHKPLPPPSEEEQKRAMEENRKLVQPET